MIKCQREYGLGGIHIMVIKSGALAESIPTMKLGFKPRKLVELVD